MDQKTIFLTILGMAAVTYGPRVLPVWFLSRRELPAAVRSWLQYVPVAVLAALFLPSVAAPESTLNIGFENLFLWASIPTILVAWKTRSLFGSVLVGMLLVALGRLLFGG